MVAKMSIQMFNRTGLLTKETTYVLKHLDKHNDWEKVKDNLRNSGYTSSKNRNREILNEIKKRFDVNISGLPHLELIKDVAKSNLSAVSKAEIYFVYLYYSDIHLKTIVDQIYEIYDYDKNNLIIERKTILQLMKLYIKKNKAKINEKTLNNWIGKFLSTLKEIKILIPKSRTSYIMNIGGLTTETWTFFLMDSYYSGYGLENALFMKTFHIDQKMIPEVIERSKNNAWITYSNKYDTKNQLNIEYEPKFECVQNYLLEFNNT